MDGSRRYETSLVAILFFAWGTVFLGRMSALYLALYFAPEFHLSHGQVGTVASVLAITWAASTFIFGALSDRVGRKPVLVPAVFAFSILSWASGLAHNFHQLLLVRALMGVAGGPTWSTMTALIEESSPHDRRGRNIGFVVSAAALVGLAAAPVLTTQVAARWGWRPAFFAAGIPGLLMSLVVWKFVEEPATDGGVHEKPSLSEYISILRYRNIWLCCLGAAGFMSWLFALSVFAPLYVTEVVHEPATVAGFLLGATGLGSFFLGFLLPSLSDRWGRKPLLLLMAAMSAVVPLAFLVPVLYVYPLVLALIVFVANSGQGIASVVLVLVPTESVPAQFRATSIGLATLAGEVAGATAAPILAGNLAQEHGLAITMWLAAAGSGLLFLAALFLRETRPDQGMITGDRSIDTAGNDRTVRRRGLRKLIVPLIQNPPPAPRTDKSPVSNGYSNRVRKARCRSGSPRDHKTRKESVRSALQNRFRSFASMNRT
jgi:predicted MFS family arabinose efflux permease